MRLGTGHTNQRQSYNEPALASSLSKEVSS